jgi:hypothetical protein
MSQDHSNQQNWEYYMFYAKVGGQVSSDPTQIWGKKRKELNNRSHWELVVEAGNNGWELVSASPWSDLGEGLTTGMVFVFKRPKRE